ncbi:hypothetical protein [Wolbachia endosymbiont (group B) of Limnophora tigrina]|uniref:actin-bundling T4SS effector WalE1 family protein n=1 Tax=Wolbachia endosymbiont (group B) of Limnophora tigrina TaxID=3139317 RepID=UPI0035B51A27
MLDNKINSSSVETQENQPEGSLDLNKMIQDPSNAELIDNSQAQQNKLFGLLKQSIKDFSMWPAEKQILAVSAAGGLLATALPLLLAAVPLAATGAMIGLALFFSVKAVQFGYKGLEWSAEKTVDGAKYTAGKVKNASVYTAEKAREGYHSVKGAISSVGRATREGTGATLGKMGRSLSNLSESMSSLDSIPYSAGNKSETVVLRTEEETSNFNSVKEMFVKEVFEDKAVNSSALTKEIFSKLGEKILEKAYSVDGQQSAKKDQLINRLKQQIDFVNKLSDKKLQNLLAQNDNNLYQIFSEHHNEIKKVIGECKTEHKLSSVVEKLNGVAKRHGESRRGSMLSNSLPRSNSLDSVRTDSTISSEAELLNPANYKEVKTATSLWDKVSSPFKSGKKSEKTTGMEDRDLDFVENPIYLSKQPRSNSLNSDDSGMGSGSSTPKGQSLSIEELKLDEAMKALDRLASQLPSTKVDENRVHHPADVKVKMN